MKTQSLPDVALNIHTSNKATIALDKVGMSNIELPVLIATEGGVAQTVGRADVAVNLKTAHRGIHMSRLYNDLVDTIPQQTLSLSVLQQLTQQFLQSHQELSDYAHIELSFELLVKRMSLTSGGYGWRSYPIEVTVDNIAGACLFTVKTTLTYSSACPCSAALSQKLIMDQFEKTFNKKQTLDKNQVQAWLNEYSLLAVPHSQRSHAIIAVELKDLLQLDRTELFLDLVNQFESIVPTPVQTMVKRADEQQFALANGENLMFCEDVARRFKTHFESEAAKNSFSFYQVRVEHLESLHAHDAVAEISSND